VIDEAAELYRGWNPRHGTDINDAILAAIAIRAQGTIYTLNHKHYPMAELDVRRAWKG
jgi:predicted nucleic acid-binding protein